MARKCAYCGVPIPSGEYRKQKYCSHAHKQAAYRQRKEKAKQDWLKTERQMLSIQTYNRARRLIECFGDEMLEQLGAYKAIHGTLAVDHLIDALIVTLDIVTERQLHWKMTNVN